MYPFLNLNVAERLGTAYGSSRGHHHHLNGKAHQAEGNTARIKGQGI
jgi:hypothetical protein